MTSLQYYAGNKRMSYKIMTTEILTTQDKEKPHTLGRDQAHDH